MRRWGVQGGNINVLNAQVKASVIAEYQVYIK